jgi:hypothetical protein
MCWASINRRPGDIKAMLCVIFDLMTTFAKRSFENTRTSVNRRSTDAQPTLNRRSTFFILLFIYQDTRSFLILPNRQGQVIGRSGVIQLNSCFGRRYPFVVRLIKRFC